MTDPIHPLLVADRVRKTYHTGAEEVEALRDVELVVHEGEFVSIMGPSGSGKTTLLNCCSGLDDIDGGRVLLDGVDLHALSDARRTANRASSMGFIFQAYNLIPVFSAVENAELPLLLAGVDGKEARRRASETLEQVGLGARLKHRPAELSGGEQQRVTVARALAGRPRVVWADEPTGALDSETAEQVMQLLRDLNADGLTLIVVTHDESVGGMANRAIKMRDGRIVSDELARARSQEARAPLRLRLSTARSRRPRFPESRMIIVALLSLPFLVVLARKPVLRRLALRNATRRPRETALVVLGSLLGTAIMTGSFVVGDTFNSSIRRMAYEQLGPVDEIVSANGLAAAPMLQARLANLHDPNVDGTLALAVTSASAATTTAPVRAAPKAQLLETDFTAARRFGGDAHATGISGPTPGPGDAAIGRDLARGLKLKVGDTIQAFAYGVNVHLRVQRVLPKLGIAGYWSGDETVSDNIFVAPGTIAGMFSRSTVPSAAPPQSLVLVSNTGGVEAGATRTVAVSRLLGARLGGVAASVNARKQAVLDRAEASGKSLSRLYTSLGTFAVLAGILLLVNIFFMLADERKSELGMLRAVGLRRRSLVGAFATEGWCYAVLSAIAGTFAGLGLGRALMAAAAKLFARRGDHTGVALHFAFKWASVERGFVIGFVIAIATVVVASIWLSRFNIIQAIRDITEPANRKPHLRSSVFGITGAAVGLLLTVAGVAGSSFLALLLGPVAVFVGVGPMLARNFPRRTVNTAIGVAVLAWAVLAVPIAIALGMSVDVLVFVVQGLVLVGAAVVLTAQHQQTIGHGIGRMAKRSLSVRLGLAYPLARRFRTSMTLGMFALVVFILVLVSVFASMFAGQIGQFTRDASGGFNVVVQSNPSNPVAFDALAHDPDVRAIVPIATETVQIVAAPGLTKAREWTATGFDARFVDHGAPKLDDNGSYPDDAAAYRAVLESPGLAIVESSFLESGGGPPSAVVHIGDHFTAQDEATGRSRIFTIAAISTSDVAGNGVLFGMPAATGLFGARAVANRAYLDVTDPAPFADAFAGRFLANGGKAETLRGVVQDDMAQQQQFFLLMRSYLALGLVVGVAGIGVIMVRAVRERRRQVGVLRALGFQAAAVRRAFVVESAFVAVEGVAIGTILALVCAWSITLSDAFGDSLPFRIPFGAIGLLVVGTFLCALLATAAPARSAARIRPAVALRLAE